MWKHLFFLFLSITSLEAAQMPTPADTNPTTPPPATHQGTALPSYMVIPPAGRAGDFQQAFELLKKEKSAGKVYFELTDGTTIGNIIDLTVMPNSTLILFRYNSTQGIRFQVVRVEEIVNLRY